MFESLLIANRGEIAVRIVRTCRRLGIRSIGVYSEADANALHVREADVALPIGGPRPQDSYLRADSIIDAARRAGARAIHPGYGFLSENADFADAVEAAGLVFIGPPGSSIRRMGSKAGAKELMQAAGVPVVPGYTGAEQAPEVLLREADRIGYPLMIKAAFGGGGKGMRIVRAHDEFLPALESCQREAMGAFGRDRMLLERYIERPRHIEFQVFADAHGNTIHLNERECSAQRRYQKVLEESPSPLLDGALREAMGAAAVAAARAIDYRNAGTVEFIVGGIDGAGAPRDFYFMEINTRLQVEHPVTELVTGLDLVEWQLRVAAGEPLPLTQNEVRQAGHAIEVRLYAEDPDAGFLPGSGGIQRLRLPAQSAHVRVDSGVAEGDSVSIHYDPMIAKLIVHDADRPRTLARLRDALAECEVEGPKSNIAFLEALVRHRAVVNGDIDTAYLDRHLEEFLQPAGPVDASLLAAAAALQLLAESSRAPQMHSADDPYSPWADRGSWRGIESAWRSIDLLHRGTPLALHIRGDGGDYDVRMPAGLVSDTDSTVAVRGGRLADGVLTARIDGMAHRFDASADARHLLVHDGRQRMRLEIAQVGLRDSAAAAAGDGSVRAPMPGRVVLLKIVAGQVVQAGDDVAVLEAMKMEIALKAPRTGTVSEVRVAAGDVIEADAILLRIGDAPASTGT